MTYTEQLTRDYAAIRARLYGSTARKIFRPEPPRAPEPEHGPQLIERTRQSTAYFAYDGPMRTAGLRWREIVNEVAERRNIATHELLGKNRARPVSYARWELWTILRDELGMTWVDIGKKFKRDHSSVVHGVTRWREISRDHA